jgi:ADP-ribose pyrophosphatase YjhB (NUDIX family)
MSPLRQTQIIVSGALFSAEGKLLLLKRGGATGGDNPEDGWDLPGGGLEFGEAPEFGVIRAFLNATGIDVSVDRPLGAWSTLRTGGGSETHRVHVDFIVRAGSPVLGVETDRELHNGFAWAARAELSRILNPGLRASCESAFALLARSRKG